MKILQIIPYYLPSDNFGGTPVVCHNLSTNLTRLGNEVTVLTTDAFSPNKRLTSYSSDRKYPYKIVRFRNVSNFLAFNFKFTQPLESIFYLGKHLKKFNVVHLNEYRTLMNLFACILKPKSNIKYILHPQGTYRNYGRSTFYKKLFDALFVKFIDKKIDLYIAISEKEKKDLIKSGVKKTKISLLYNGIDKIRNKKVKFIVPRNYFLYLGQISERKGAQNLVKSFYLSGVYKKGYKLLVVGRDDGYLNILKNKIIAFGISKYVIFHKAVSQAESRYLLKKSRLVYYVSKNEAFGLVPLEAAVNGTWSLVENSSGVAEILKKYSISETSNFEDVKTISNSLLKFSRTNKRIPSKKVQNIAHDFSWKKKTLELVEIYNSLI